MSRLDSMIRRLEAQRACLGHAAGLIVGVEGPVLELGLGNGRTFDHLRELLPDREIFAFDLTIAAHPASIPDAHHMIVGDMRDTLPHCGARVGGPAALVHCDLGTGDETANTALAQWLSPLITDRVAPGGIVVSNIALEFADWAEEPLPAGVGEGRYHIYRRP